MEPLQCDGELDDEFFARSALDVGPHPTQPVLIADPPIEAGSGRHVTILSLFIDENGRVVRIRVDGPTLPEAMEDAARRAFMEATFAAGQVDGLPVRSWIRVAVVFAESAAGR
jgi:periplasmic protein TonB